MKESIKNAKVVFSNACEAAICRLLIIRAVLSFIVARSRLKKLHPVRDARKRENLGFQLRANKLAVELNMQKLRSI